MAKRQTYAIRGTFTVEGEDGPESLVYKVVNGRIKRVSEARGEDRHDSHFHAIFYGAQAFRNWKHDHIGLRFDMKVIEVDEPC